MPFLYPFTFCSIWVRRSILSKTAELLGFSVNFRTVCANASSLLSRQDIADQSTRFTKALLWCLENNVEQRAESLLSKMDRKKQYPNITMRLQLPILDAAGQWIGPNFHVKRLTEPQWLKSWEDGRRTKTIEEARTHTRSDKFSYLGGIIEIGYVFISFNCIHCHGCC